MKYLVILLLVCGCTSHQYDNYPIDDSIVPQIVEKTLSQDNIEYENYGDDINHKLVHLKNGRYLLILYYPEQGYMYAEIQNSKYDNVLARKKLLEDENHKIFIIYKLFLENHRYYQHNSPQKQLEANKEILMEILYND